LTVPHDLSVIGVDDITLAAHTNPSLTTISIPKCELAQAVTELLLENIQRAGDSSDTPEKSLQYLFSPQLIVRQSTDVPHLDK
jgi:LacI family transcriptional regulator